MDGVCAHGLPKQSAYYLCGLNAVRMSAPASSLFLLADALEVSDPPPEFIDEETAVRWLADVVDYWMQYRMEQLMSLCYTLDVDENFVAAAFHPAALEPANIGLARLLFRRQQARLATRQQFPSPPLDDEDAW